MSRIGRWLGGQGTYGLGLDVLMRELRRLRALRAGFQLHLAKLVQPSELVTVVSSLAALRT